MEPLAPVTAVNRVCLWWRRRPWLTIAVGSLSLLCAFYAEEDLRGKRAWLHARYELQARGTSVNWSAYVPTPLPDDQNILKAPKMEEWFGHPGGNELTHRLGTLYEFSTRRNTNVVAVVEIVPPPALIDPQAADLVLRYRHSAATLDSPGQPTTPNTAPESEVIPLIVMDEVPMTDAIKHLARQANLHYVLTPSTGLGIDGPQPTVSFRWENVTAEQALMALLRNYNLRWIDEPQTGIARILPQNGTGPKICATPAVRGRIDALLAKALEQNSVTPPTLLRGAQDIALVSREVTIAKPLRVTVRSEWVPDATEISEFFPDTALGYGDRAGGRLRTEPAGSNTFRVFLGPPTYYTASEYLAWSDQFTNDFAVMREALKRPAAQLDGNYLLPPELPQPNYVVVRLAIQTLAQRAQCLLLAGRPQEALQDLTLINRICHLTDRKYARGPVTIVQAMIQTAVTGVYVNAISDGLRLRAWQEPQLAALQRQLEEIDLPPQLVAALQTEGAALCRSFENLGPRRVLKSHLFAFADPNAPNLWQKTWEARSAVLALVPRGWVYQNMAVVARLNQLGIDAFEASNQTVVPERVDAFSRELEGCLGQVTIDNFMAAVATPDFSHAWRVLAKNQVLANEAFMACALERYRLACGDYPENLDALVPRWANRLPHDLIGGRPLHYRRADQGAFVLYSVGWDGTDDGGRPSVEPGGQSSPREGDWVWR